MKVRGERPLWPPNPAPYLAEWLFEIGPTVPGGMAEAPIGWQDIVAWSVMTGIELDPWEAKTIRRLSVAFVAQRHASEKPDCIAPYIGDAEPIAVVRDRVSSQFAAMFAAMKARSGPA